ncbi:MAG TPA: hydantoinase B/oxoprolinase family protein [Nitrososphaerales archaeon]|nr:hydantoinase B/oxoprolinase family protein [Nitrososphaerales archaeon]
MGTDNRMMTKKKRKDMSGKPLLDSTTFGLFWDRLISVTDEAYSALIRSSFSPIVREALDATCQLFDSKGRSIAQAWAGPPSFIGTLPTTLAEMLKVIPVEDLKPGDVLATNNPWIGTGQVNDISVILPIFSSSTNRGKGEIIGYAGAVSHLPDIGGQIWSATAGEVFEEGLQLPPLKIMSRGVFDRTIREIISANVRLPAQTIADIMSDISSAQTMSRLLLGILAEYNLRDLEWVADRIIETSVSAVRSELEKLPEGVGESEVGVEGFGVDHKIHCKVSHDLESMLIDFAGTSPRSDYGINSPFVYTRAYTVYAAKCVVAPYVPNNQGTMDVFKVEAPENSVLNPRPPAACGARHIMGWHAPIAVWKALSQIVPDRTIADTGLPSSCTVKGTDSKGRPFVAITVIGGGGMGARPESDGLNSTGIPTVTSHISAEVLESTTPLLVEELKLIPDSGGAGKFRGGLGVSYTIRNISGRPAKVAFIGNKSRFPPEGLKGGMSGTPRKCFVDGSEVSSMGMYALRENGTIRMDNAGSGGFYDPHERDEASIESDLRNGFITKKAALELYGYA